MHLGQRRPRSRKPIRVTSNNSIPKHAHPINTMPTCIVPIGHMPHDIDFMTYCAYCPTPYLIEDILETYESRKKGLETPVPELHKVVLTWHRREALYDDFKEEFGEPQRKTKRGYTFANGVFLSKYNIGYWYTIRFTVTDEILAGIQNIMYKTSAERGSLRLYTVEVMWNFAFAGKLYGYVERLQRRIALNMLPSFVQARLRFEPPTGGKIRENPKYGTADGRQTAYFNKRQRGKDGNDTFVRKPAWKPKMYAKRINGTWTLHIEVTLEKRFLKKNNLECDIPRTVTPDWLTRYPLHSFLKATGFCRRKFACAMRETDTFKEWTKEQEATQRRYKRVHPNHARIAAALNIPACEQKRMAYQIADEMQARRLKQRVTSGELDCPYNLFTE